VSEGEEREEILALREGRDRFKREGERERPQAQVV
jgi:hypothetical protein